MATGIGTMQQVCVHAQWNYTHSYFPFFCFVFIFIFRPVNTDTPVCISHNIPQNGGSSLADIARKATEIRAGTATAMLSGSKVITLLEVYFSSIGCNPLKINLHHTSGNIAPRGTLQVGRMIQTLQQVTRTTKINRSFGTATSRTPCFGICHAEQRSLERSCL